MDWSCVDERLIRQGELLLSLDFLEGYDRELRRMNRGKVGRTYTLTERYVEFLTIVRYLFCFPFRHFDGFTRASNRFVPKLPSTDYLDLRRRILGPDLSLYEPLKLSGEPVVTVDSTGVRVHKAGGWVERKHRKKKR